MMRTTNNNKQLAYFRFLPGPPEIPVSTAKFPREVRIFPKIPVIETTTIHHRQQHFIQLILQTCSELNKAL